MPSVCVTASGCVASRYLKAIAKLPLQLKRDLSLTGMLWNQ